MQTEIIARIRDKVDGNYEELKELELNNCQLRDFQFLKEFPKLKKLRACFNDFGRVEIGDIHRELLFFNISKSNITSIDPELPKSLPKLRVFVSMNNELDSIDFIKEFRDLQELCITNCDLSIVPMDVMRWKARLKMRKLDLSMTKLHSIASLTLPNLESLSLDGNPFTMGVDPWREMNSLIDLSMAHTNFSSLQDLHTLAKLNFLNLASSECDLGTMPHLPSLISLQLNDREITTFSFLQNLPALQDLDLTGCIFTPDIDFSDLLYSSLLNLIADEDTFQVVEKYVPHGCAVHRESTKLPTAIENHFGISHYYEDLLTVIEKRRRCLKQALPDEIPDPEPAPELPTTAPIPQLTEIDTFYDVKGLTRTRDIEGEIEAMLQTKDDADEEKEAIARELEKMKLMENIDPLGGLSVKDIDALSTLMDTSVLKGEYLKQQSATEMHDVISTVFDLNLDQVNYKTLQDDLHQLNVEEQAKDDTTIPKPKPKRPKTTRQRRHPKLKVKHESELFSWDFEPTPIKRWRT
ncbi:hypothetical protein PCE1_004965 [Barthelona sp. PCE]